MNKKSKNFMAKKNRKIETKKLTFSDNPFEVGAIRIPPNDIHSETSNNNSSGYKEEQIKSKDTSDNVYYPIKHGGIGIDSTFVASILLKLESLEKELSFYHENLSIKLDKEKAMWDNFTKGILFIGIVNTIFMIILMGLFNN